MAAYFVKNGSAPSGALTVSTAHAQYTFPDTVTQVLVTNDEDVDDLGKHPFLTLVGSPAGSSSTRASATPITGNAGAWQANLIYSAGQVVQRSGQSYVCLSSSLNQDPATTAGAAFWQSLTNFVASNKVNAPGAFGGLAPSTTRGRHVDASKSGATAGQSNGTDTVNTARIQHIVARGFRGIRVAFSNFVVANNLPTASELDGPQTITVTASIEDSGGNIYPLHFRGQRAVGIDPGGIVLSDPLAFDAATGDTIYSRTMVQVSVAATKFQLGTTTVSANGEGVDHSSTVLVDSGTITPSSELAYGPQAICGIRPRTVQRAIGVIGDSIAAGFNDSTVTSSPNSAADGGYVVRGIGNSAAIVQLSCGGERADFVNQIKMRRRRAGMLADCTDVLLALGINDLTAPLSAAAINADLDALIQLLTDMSVPRIWVATVGPKCTSTDKFITTTNMTANAGIVAADRLAINAHIRGLSLSGGIIEVADALETTRDSGVWKTGGATFTANLHTGTVVIDNVSTLTVPNNAIIRDSGGAISQRVYVLSGGGTSALTLTGNNLGQTITGATVGYPLTDDGLHPNGAGYAILQSLLTPLTT